jgi:hypothetical protein
LSRPVGDVTNKDVVGLETVFICFAYNHNNLQKVCRSYHCLDHFQGTPDLHLSGADLPTSQLSWPMPEVLASTNF